MSDYTVGFVFGCLLTNVVWFIIGKFHDNELSKNMEKLKSDIENTLKERRIEQ